MKTEIKNLKEIREVKNLKLPELLKFFSRPTLCQEHHFS